MVNKNYLNTSMVFNVLNERKPKKIISENRQK